MNWLKKSSTHKVGMCSYIGERGAKSQERRNSLRIQARLLNEWLSSSGVLEKSENQLCILCSTIDKLKKVLKREIVTCHLDDKWEVIEQVIRNKAHGVYFSRRGWPDWYCAETVQEYLKLVDEEFTSRILFQEPFFSFH